jgi:alkanesulfonate monooxygenase SsuD/methylene tetrahydromethanopterin reductase-like flavin-dependent oxidoreductase (luciferase family)
VVGFGDGDRREDIDMAQGFALAAGTRADIIEAAAREAERLGYTSFWVNHPGPTDGLAALAVAARASERLDVGVGVVPLHTRGPESIVEGVRATGLPASRLLLGVGSPNPGALARVRAGVTALRGQVQARVVVAALGPQMCRLAGAIADGVLFNWLTPEHARRSLEWVRAGAADAGRQPPRTFAYVRLAVGPAGCERLADEGARYAAIPAYANHFTRMGVKPVETAIGVESPDRVRAALAAWHGVIDEIVLRAVPADDTADAVLSLVRAAA